jgi:cysteine synthase A
MKRVDNVTQLIGQTPMVELNRLTRAHGLEGHIWAKIEFFNPGFSKKDRIALQMIEEAEADGSLRSGQTVVELTSGNTGTGLAIVCAVKGYPFVAVMSEGNSMERAAMMRALGAEVVLVPQAPGSLPGQVSGEDLRLVEERTAELVRKRDAFRADQFTLQGNVRAHLLTGEEIWEQSEGHVEVFVDFPGTGGAFVGIARALRRHNPKIRCYVVEPEGAAYLAGEVVTRPNHRIQGGGYAMDLPLWDPSLVDGFLTVTDEEAMAACREMARLEDIFAGFSSGASVAAAIQLLEGPEKGRVVICTVNDSGLKYLSTDLWRE